MDDDVKDFVKNNKIRTPGEFTEKQSEICVCNEYEEEIQFGCQKATELNGYRVVFVDNASNMHADPMPDYCSVYMLQTDYDEKGRMDRLINTIIAIAEKYKELLRKKGYDVDNVPLTKI